MDIGMKIKTARQAKGMTQKELGEALGVQKSAIAKYENGRVVNIKRNTLKKISDILEIPPIELVFGENKEQPARGPLLVGAENKRVMAKNLIYYIERSGKTQKEIAESVGVASSTFNAWVKAKKYPRIDKIELMADYFGILKSDLIEEKNEQPAESELSVRKKTFMRKVQGMSDAQIERLEQILALVEKTEL